MRIISKSRRHFHGTHKGYIVVIEKEASGRFWIDVSDGAGRAYLGYAPEGVTTMPAAKREAIKGACL